MTSRANAAKLRSTTFNVASSLNRKDRWSKWVEPTETSRPSMISSLQWYMVGSYSAMMAPAASRGPQVVREALRTVALSMCLPGTTMRSLTPRLIASTMACNVKSSGTK